MTDYTYASPIPLPILPKGKLLEIRVTDTEVNKQLEFVFEDMTIWIPIEAAIILGGFPDRYVITDDVIFRDDNTTGQTKERIKYQWTRLD